MPLIKIFISHSTKTEEAEKFLDEVERALAADFEVRLDRAGLRGGDDWRAKLYEWMDEVHGAVLLLTAEALTSKFVQVEASVLSWRRFRQPEFVLLPVLVGGVGVEDLAGGLFGEMELNRIQAISLEDPCALAAEVARLLQSLKGRRKKPRTAKEVLEQRVVRLLKKQFTGEDDLWDVGEKALGWGARDFPQGTDFYEEFARDLLSGDVGAACDAVRELADAGVEDAIRLLEIVAPSWVDEEDARPIAKLALSDLPRLAVGINADDIRWTLNSYIGRSCFTSINHGLDVCPLVPPGYEDSLTHFRQQILEYFKPTMSLVRPGDARQVEEIMGLIRKRDEIPQPAFVVFPPGFVPDAPLLNSLREEFRTVTFVVLAGDAPPQKLSAIADKVFLLKPVDPKRRQDSHQEYETALAKLKKAQERTW